MSRTYTILAAVLCVSTFCHGQKFKSDTVFIAKATNHALRLYAQSVGAQSGLHNGSAYVEYQPLKEEHPYFIPEWAEGNIQYDGNLYDRVPLLYDLSTDKVITEHTGTLDKIQLVDEKVQFFILNKHRFVYLTDQMVPKGFYEIVHDSITQVFVRREKAQQERNTVTEVVRTFEEKKWYYIYKDNTYFPVRNKKAVLLTFKDKKADLKKFISKNRLKFNNDKIESVRLLAEQYDRLKQ
jgi:hypothetical protein